MKIKTLPVLLLLICLVFGNNSSKAQIVNAQSSKNELLQYHLSQLARGEYQPGQLIVKFSKGVEVDEKSMTTGSTRINAVLSSMNTKDVKSVFNKDMDKNAGLKKQFGLSSFYILQFGAGTDLTSAMKKLAELDEIEMVEPNYLASGSTIPNDPLYTQQWALNNTGQAESIGGALVGTPGVDINAEAAWDLQTGSEDVVVCILDTGVDTDHPEFAGRIVPGYDFQFDDDDPNPIPGENGGAHGTCCAGIVGASGNNGIGVAGIAWETKIMPVKVLYDNSGTWEIIASGITWAADNGADILSMSIQGGSYSTTLNTAVDYAFSLGCTLLAAAGNWNLDLSLNPSYPGVFANTICIGALSPCGERTSPSSCDGEDWWGSNYGTALDFLAPGTRNYTTDITGTDGYDGGDYYPFFNGTSSACPHAAGIAALMLAENPLLTNTQIRDRMQMSCVDIYNPGKDDESGWGRIDAYEAVLNATNDQSALRVLPSSWSVSEGEAFSVEFYIENVTNLASYEITCSYEPDYMDLIGDEFGDFIYSTGRTEGDSWSAIDAINGYFTFAQETTGLTPPGPDGNGSLFTVHFAIINNPPDYGNLQFNVTEYTISQPDGTPIIPIIVNGSVELTMDYCTTGLYSTGCSDGDYINYVSLANLENASSGCSDNGYGDFTYLSANVVQGETYDLVLEVGIEGQYVSAWVDFNDNYLFEAGEMILDNFYIDYPNEMAYTDVFIFEDAAPGEHRLRLRSVWGESFADACGEYTWGETEDYTINVLPQDQYGRLDGYVYDDNTGEPIVGATILLYDTGVSETTNDDGYYCFSPEAGFIGMNCTAPGYSTIYGEYVDVYAGEQTFWEFYMVQGYCTEDLYYNGCYDGDGIDNFFFGDIYNPESGCSDNGYGDFTYMSTEVWCGEEVGLEVSSNYDSQFICIWIDFNDDSSFSPDELILENEFLELAGELYYFPVYIMGSCQSGEHRMRVRANFGSPFYDACETLDWGEVEDYTVVVYGDQEYGTLGGTVYNWDTGLPQPDIEVMHLNLGISAFSGPDGTFSFGSVPAGPQDLLIDQEGFFALGINIEVFPDESTIFSVDVKPVHSNIFDIPQGWSGISSVFYTYSYVSTIFDDNIDDVVIISSMDGFYYPGQNVNTLGAWANSPGYKIKASNPFNFEHPGWMRKPAELTVPAGWSILPGWNECPISIDQLFGARALSLPVIVKEIAGPGVYWPNQSVYTLNVLEPGKAYMLNMDSESSVVYPGCPFKDDPVVSKNSIVNNSAWSDPVMTANSHLIHVPVNLIEDGGLNAGDYLGAFDVNDNCFGMIQVLENNNYAIAAFADDQLTTVKDGFFEGDLILIKAFKLDSGETIDLDVEFDLQMPDQQMYRTDGMSSVALKSAGFADVLNGQNQLIHVYPNPGNGLVNVHISDKQSVSSIDIFDNHGKLVLSGQEVNYNNGVTQIDLRGMPAGLYSLKVITESTVIEEKIIIQ
jgi:subtilisin family serine protease